MQQLQKDPNTLVEVLQADHPHDIRRIIAVRIWTFLVSDDQTRSCLVHLDETNLTVFYRHSRSHVLELGADQ